MKKIEIYLKNILLKLLLMVFKTGAPEASALIDEHSHLLFIRLNKIGDALVTTPLLKIVKEAYGCRITVLADKKNHFIFTNNKFVDEVIVFNKGIKGFSDFKKYMDEHKVSAVIDLHDDVSTTVSFVLAISGVAHRIGLEKGNAGLYTDTVMKLDPARHHVVDRNLELLKAFRIDKLKYSPNIIYDIKPENIDSVNEYLEKNFSGSNKLVGINISAGSEARFWGMERYKKLIKELGKLDINLLMLSSPADEEIANQIAYGSVPIFNTTDFNEFAAMISKLDLLFTPDTSIVHIASAYEVPVFGIYVKYNTTDMIWSPYKSEFDFIITEEPNFTNLEFDEVYSKFETFLKKQLGNNEA